MNGIAERDVEVFFNKIFPTGAFAHCLYIYVSMPHKFTEDKVDGI